MLKEKNNKNHDPNLLPSKPSIKSVPLLQMFCFYSFQEDGKVLLSQAVMMLFLVGHK